MRRHFEFSHVTQELSIVLLLFAFVAAASLAPMCEQLWNTKSTGKDQQNVGISLWLWAASKKKKTKDHKHLKRVGRKARETKA